MAKHMQNKEMAAVKGKLLHRKAELWRDIAAELEKDAGEEYQDLIQTVRDEGDDAMAELEESTIFSLIELKYKEARQIEQALQRIEEGTYGRCISCGGSIALDRLEVMPFALRCHHCQEKMEQIEKIGSSPG